MQLHDVIKMLLNFARRDMAYSELTKLREEVVELLDAEIARRDSMTS